MVFKRGKTARAKYTNASRIAIRFVHVAQNAIFILGFCWIHLDSACGFGASEVIPKIRATVAPGQTLRGCARRWLSMASRAPTIFHAADDVRKRSRSRSALFARLFTHQGFPGGSRERTHLACRARHPAAQIEKKLSGFVNFRFSVSPEFVSRRFRLPDTKTTRAFGPHHQRQQQRERHRARRVLRMRHRTCRGTETETPVDRH